MRRSIPLLLAGLLASALASVAVAAPLPAETRAALKGFEGIWQGAPRRGPGGPGGPGGGVGGRPPGGRGGPPPAVASDPASARLMENVEGLEGGDLAVYRQMTPAGRAAFEAMDPHDLPANNCRAAGVPTLAAIPQMQAWSVTGDGLKIHHEEFDTVRTVAFDPPAVAEPAAQIGHAQGSYADGVVTIRTTGFTPSAGALSRNAPGSAAKTVTERYRLTDGGAALSLEMTVEDPLYLTHPLIRRITLRRAAPGAKIETFPCDPEAAQRHLHAKP